MPIKRFFYIGSALLLWACCFSLAAETGKTTLRQADDIVSDYRKIIVLMDGEAGLDPVNRDRVAMVGKMLFEQDHEHLSSLSAGLATDLHETEAFLDALEKSADYHDVDKLVFREMLDDLADSLQKRGDTSAAVVRLEKRIAEDNAALDQIQALYQKELDQVFGNFQKRGMPIRREAWGHYMEFLKQKYSREQILKEYEDALPPSESRGVGKKKNTRGEIFGTELPPKTLLLTFDDGPHPRYTDRVLEILAKYKIQAVFFQVGKNLGSIDKSGEVKLAPAAQASYRILESGSSLGNHSYTHPMLPKLNAAGYSNEIESTNTLLKYISKSDPVLFRPPYGARNDAILAFAQSQKLKSMIWNIDSLDWADPVPNSVAQRVLKEVEQQNRGVILFHDIHKRTLEVLPPLIETLLANGYHFAAWNGNGFSTNEARGIQAASQPTPMEAPYRESWAAVIGIDSYQNWPKLRYAANDAQAVRDLLVQKYKFKPQNVFLLVNQDATRQNIQSLLGDKLGNPDMVKREDRVFVFFAGHGATRKLPSGRELGYIIPVDADLSNYQGQSISMTNFQDIAEAIPAKHLLFVMDSCYSGLALTRGGSATGSRNYIQEIARREARQMFTAGGADQQVADNGPNGHSIFTWTLLQALDGRADLNGDGIITATELAAYVAPMVSSLSHQTPAFGNLVGSEGGDFIFDLKHDSEFLSADSNQLSDDAIRLNSELERLRSQNEQLRQQLAAAQSRQAQQASRGQTPAVETALTLNDEGMRLYKEKNYSEAAAKFIRATQLDPTSALAANNAGFAFYKQEKYEEAIKWLNRAIEIDPRRAIAYMNLGDAYAKLKRDAEARHAYEIYLQLGPPSKSAEYARQKLQELAK
ncbi:MAG TPA: polysaccharide deacetylase family protein [Candidatus Angelobacter sp.]|jgi:peptidoglycan/xylan/chitin deacetylase (PgdA/CDA1 family)/tetratricopeptide (TPR) repeat protein|nr:polysaccharide deacetylase family protein [Candidatus Angelobacter sp.]